MFTQLQKIDINIWSYIMPQLERDSDEPKRVDIGILYALYYNSGKNLYIASS